LWEASAIEPKSRLSIGFVVGKRDEPLIAELMESAKKRIDSPKDPVLLSDGHNGYESLFPSVFGERALPPGAQGKERALSEGETPHQQKPRSPAVDRAPPGWESGGGEARGSAR
jgi:hypothetical protein